MSSVVYRGSCLCGDITFDLEGEPEKVFSCYCLDCLKNSGSPFQVVAKYDSNNIAIYDPKNLRSTWIIQNTQSGHEKHKIFCGQCGCTLWTIPMRYEGMKVIVRTSLVDGGLEEWPPKAQLFAESRPSWMTKVDIAV